MGEPLPGGAGPKKGQTLSGAGGGPHASAVRSVAVRPPGSQAWLAGALLVFWASLALHLPVSDLSDALVRWLGFFRYDRLLLLSFAGLGAGAWLAVGWRRSPHRRAAWSGMTVLLGAAALAQQSLIVANIENIHYVQYALLTFLLGRSGLSTEASWAGATVLGIVDEAYQYLLLPRGRPTYLDWNDIVLNALGSAFGVVALLLARDVSRERPLCATRVALAAGVAALALALVIDRPLRLALLELTPGGRPFHVLSAAAAVAIISLVWLSVRGVLAWCRAGGVGPKRA